ncbi:MAG: 50S ribosomal protein L25/general stress protein Ctc [Propylenella sp.]
MAQTSVLKAEARERVGKGAARAVRREDKIPAVIYGDKKPPIPISLPQREVTQRLHAGGFLTHLMQIEVNGEEMRVIPKDYQLDPVRDFLIHVDFLRVGEGARLTLDVPVHFRNHVDSPGLKRGGVLNVVRHAIELVVPADTIPEFIEVDLTGLEIGDSFHISSVALPEGVVPTVKRDFTIATIAGSAAMLPEEEEAKPEGEEVVEGEEAAEGEKAEGEEPAEKDKAKGKEE